MKISNPYSLMNLNKIREIIGNKKLRDEIKIK
jgi:hypothetical protein